MAADKCPSIRCSFGSVQERNLSIFRTGANTSTPRASRRRARRVPVNPSPSMIAINAYCSMNAILRLMLLPTIFREYDIRGIADSELPSDGVNALGQAFGTYLIRQGSKRVNLARDCRKS